LSLAPSFFLSIAGAAGALSREAIARGYSILFTTAVNLVASLSKAAVENQPDDQMTFFTKPKLPVVDELDYLPFEKDAAHLFFQLVSRRYEHCAMLLTTNRSVGEWVDIFGDTVIATAILDRLLPVLGVACPIYPPT